jgi:hypothetical protein
MVPDNLFALTLKGPISEQMPPTLRFGGVLPRDRHRWVERHFRHVKVVVQLFCSAANNLMQQSFSYANNTLPFCVFGVKTSFSRSGDPVRYIFRIFSDDRMVVLCQ